MSAVKIGIYLMISSILSLLVTEPLKVGYFSGVAFCFGLFFTWAASVVWAFKRFFRRS